ncbi:hypothetical protein HMPREF9622_01961 [Cutibacterium modestum HL037PA3]|jgi:hypothetical protein|uniref:Uncharacterized protein n=1 Tax=Cutibacterium modestum TaxID=2559073 RepID=A0AAD1KS30_9ACTN|nr:hypothetical protein HMPREF9622_01961 [Cutibacterium modestum HL037PA3]BCY26523.1 hypothetical protein KB1_25130 [Cutibacterium modestum]
MLLDNANLTHYIARSFSRPENSDPNYTLNYGEPIIVPNGKTRYLARPTDVA